MKTHFRTIRMDRTLCGRESDWLGVAWYWRHVTCKQCLKNRGRQR